MRGSWLKVGITVLLAVVMVAGGITATPVYSKSQQYRLRRLDSDQKSF